MELLDPDPALGMASTPLVTALFYELLKHLSITLDGDPFEIEQHLGRI